MQVGGSNESARDFSKSGVTTTTIHRWDVKVNGFIRYIDSR